MHPALRTAVLGGALAVGLIGTLLVLSDHWMAGGLLVASPLLIWTMGRDGIAWGCLFAFLVSMSALNVSRFTFADFVAVPAVALGLLGALKHGRTVIPGWALFMPLGVLLVAAPVTLVQHYPVTDMLVFVGSLLLAPLIICLQGCSENRLRLLIAAFVLGAFVNAGLAIYDAATPGVTLADFTGHGGDLRPAGLTTHSNQLGLLCGMAAPLALFLAGRSRLWWLVFAGLAGGALASGSRGGVLGFAFAVLVYLAIDRSMGMKRFLQLCALGAIGVAIAVRAGLTVALDRLAGGETAAEYGVDTSDSVRLSLAEQALADFKTHLFTGIGYVGNASAHNYYLQVARSGGVLVVVVIVIGSLIALRQGWRVRHLTAAAPAALAAASTWTLFAVQHNAFNQRFLWFPLGLLAAAYLLARSRLL